MHSIDFRFELEIPSIDLSPPPGVTPIGHAYARFHTGPYFYKWRPAEKDQIVLTANDPDASLGVWYQGWDGRLPDGREIEFHEADPPWRVRDGGNLHGELTLEHIDEEVIDVLNRSTRSERGNGHRRPREIEIYRDLAVRVRDAVFDPLNWFLNQLRYRFGQYWVQPLPRNRNRGDPNSFIDLFITFRWSIDVFETEFEFDPPSLERPSTIPDDALDGATELITESDWTLLGELAATWNSDGRQAFGVEHDVYQRAVRARDLGDLRSAYVDAVSALDVIVAKKEKYLGIVDKPDGLSVRAERVLGSFPAGAKRAIKTRNRVAHEGYVPSDSDTNDVDALIQSVWEHLEPRPKRPTAIAVSFRESSLCQIADDVDDNELRVSGVN